PMALALVYHAGYDFELPDFSRPGGSPGRGSLHAFDGRRASRALGLFTELLAEAPGHGAAATAAMPRWTSLAPTPATRAELGRVHHAAYLDELEDPARRAALCAELMDLPAAAGADPELLETSYLAPMRVATGGTLAAVRWLLGGALEATPSGGAEDAAHPRRIAPVAINLSGGYHHAGPGRGGGFCAYNDLALAAELAVREYGARRVLCIDLDAHQGDGTARCFAELGGRFSRAAAGARAPRLELLDLFNGSIWPGDLAARELATWSHALPDGTAGAIYLDVLDGALAAVLSAGDPPDLVLYNAGSDVLAGDPLGRLELDLAEVAERDRRVLAAAHAAGAPLLAVASGGYTDQSHRALAGLLDLAAQRSGSSTAP
ncbi:MAG: hypothetical protein P1V81_06025, partial [Planctomycetota bacterium]|nr:hypothetical protein [Planctomycetota bacterium]